MSCCSQICEGLWLSSSGFIHLRRLPAGTEAALGSAGFRAWPSSVFSSYSVSEREVMGDDFSICKLPSNGKKNGGGKWQAFHFPWPLRARLFSCVCAVHSIFQGAIFLRLSQLAKLFCHWRLLKVRMYVSVTSRVLAFSLVACMAVG